MKLNKSNYATAFKYLVKGLKEVTSVKKKYKDHIKKIVEEYDPKIIRITELRQYVFKFDSKFFKYFVENIVIDGDKDDRYYTRLINALKRKFIIHPASSNFPEGLALVSINKNIPSLVVHNFTFVDTFIGAKRMLIEKYYSEKDIYEKELYLYIYLRIFHIRVFSKNELKSLKMEYIFLCHKKLSIFLIELKNMVSSDKIFLYQLQLLDKDVSEMLYAFKTSLSLSMFKNLNGLEKKLEKYIQKELCGAYRKTIADARNNAALLQNMTKPVDLMIQSRKQSTPGLTLLELKKIYPNVHIDEALINKDIDNVKYMRTSASARQKIKAKKNKQSTVCDIVEMKSFQKLLSKKDDKLLKDAIEYAIQDLEYGIKISKGDLHANMIFTYFIYELERVKEKKISLTTFKSYYGILNKHLFDKVEDLFHMESYEFNTVIQDIQETINKKNTLKKIHWLIKKFFIFHQKNKNIDFDMGMIYYPKSFVFKNEFDELIVSIEKKYKKRFKIKNNTPNNELIITQMQLIAILGFYGGLRKTEIISCELRSVFFLDNVLYVDVHRGQGMKKLSKKLKTKSSKRLVPITIENEDHLKIVKKWCKYRKDFHGNQSIYAFMNYDRKYKRIIAEAVKEEDFNIITKLIKDITSRYCTFHSLRHSYATYAFQKLQSKTPYALFELSVTLGHNIPDVTIGSYVHADALSCMVLDEACV